jgi:hypothetical protein
MRTKAKWGPDSTGWSIQFALKPEARERLISLTSVDAARKLEEATKLFKDRTNIKDQEQSRAELREALKTLRKWTAQADKALPEMDDTLEIYGWTRERFNTMRAELQNLGSAADRILSETKPQRGARTKTIQNAFALHVKNILQGAGIKAASGRDGIFCKTLTLLLTAAGEGKDAHRLVEETINLK